MQVIYTESQQLGNIIIQIGIQKMNTDKPPKIRVLVRKRPLSKKQHLKGELDIVSIQNNQTVIVRQQKLKVDLTPFIDEYKFNFDGAFDQHATNQQIYLTSIRPLVDCAFDGARVSCFAYGQTGSGKTYTMLGDGQNVKGLYLLAAYDIFQQLSQYEKLSVWISFYEIYCGKLYDLLNDRNVLFAREDAKSNVNIVGLSERKIMGVDNLMQIIQFGTGVRVTAQNGTNVDSSRSHAILQISLKIGNKIHGKISFIDLAGSERAADHADQLEKQTRIDGAQINKSLLALKQCIRALDQNKNHTPFRGSKLTMVLKDSFTGYCRTVMIGNVSPNSTSSQNTLNTLKYADRVKELKRPNRETQMLQMDNLDQLSRELMLPRQMVNHKKYQNNGTTETEYNHRPLKPVNHHNNNRQQPPQMPTHNPSHKPIPKKFQQPPLFIKTRDQPAHSHQNSPYNKQYQYDHKQLANVSMKVRNGLVQQEEPVYESLEQENFQSLSRRHESLIQQVIDEQEQLISCHQQQINSTIQLVKKQMILMNEADKIGSDISRYLDELDEVLDQKQAANNELRARVKQLRRHIKESNQVERKYIEQSGRIGGDEGMLLDDDQHLFH